MSSTKSNEPPSHDPRAAQESDQQTGASDDPRVDPTPDNRQSDTDGTAKQ